MSDATLFRQVSDYANRADPYPLYAEMRKTPVVQDDDGLWIVSTYRENLALLHDPRISSARRDDEPGPPPPVAPFLRLDPPDHDRIRRLAMRPFGPPHTPGMIAGLEAGIAAFVDNTVASWTDRNQVDIVDDFAYPLPIMVICKLLGVPPEDEARFEDWVSTIVLSLDAAGADDADAIAEGRQVAMGELAQYLAGLVADRRKAPQDDLLSAYATDDGPEGAMNDGELITTAVLLLIAGHETTVNLIANGMLTLLRNPTVIDDLRVRPELIVPLVEELLRFEPPAQFVPDRSTLADVSIAGVTIPKDSRVVLMLASGNRDPHRFPHAERFVPDRLDNQHLGFGSGIHNCFGAPLARLEAQHALTALADGLDNPTLVADPPPYRPAAVLRGPLHLSVAFDAVREPVGTRE